MSVWIKQVNVTNLGPLGDMSFEFGKLNLIYGQNETGKTFITEFLLRSIFKHPSISKWPLRDLPGQGKVVLSGIEEGDTNFTPGSRKKIEDFWEQDDSGLPTNMARLLVVKGGELQLIHSDKESNRSILTNVLSQNALFEKILKSISTTTQKAEISDVEITGEKRGDIKARIDLIDQRRNIGHLIDDIEAKYSLGPLREKEEERENLAKRIQIQENAKRYHAYELKNKINQLENELISEEYLGSLHDDLKDYKDVMFQAESLKTELKKKEDVTQDFPWLEQAVRTWESMGLDSAQKPKKTLLIFTAILLALGLFAMAIRLVFDLNSILGTWNLVLGFLSLLFFLVGLGLLGIYIFRLNYWAKFVLQADERDAIKGEYETRFQKSVGSLTDLKTHLEGIRNDFLLVSNLPKQIEEFERKQKKFSEAIREKFSEFIGEDLDSSKWENAYHKIKKQQEDNNQKLEKLKLALAKLDIRDKDFRYEPAEEMYNPDVLNDLNEKKDANEVALHDIEAGLDNLKVRACQETGDDVGANWTMVLENIHSKQDELDSDYKIITAKIIGEIGLTRIVQDLKQKEEDKIRKGIQSKEVVDILSTVTSHYRSLDINGEKLIVTGDYGDYDIDYLSTGAKEQVFLALRMGFASRLAGGRPLFMIMDDAFQHSDWERRRHLFDVIINLVDSGWQMIYLTMDNHIRDLCCELGREKLGEEFRFIPIS